MRAGGARLVTRLVVERGHHVLGKQADVAEGQLLGQAAEVERPRDAGEPGQLLPAPNGLDAVVRIAVNYASGEDVLGFTNQLGISGIWDGATGTLTLFGAAPASDYQIALRSVTYTNASDNPSTAARTISFAANDGTADSAIAVRQISVSAVKTSGNLGSNAMMIALTAMIVAPAATIARFERMVSSSSPPGS